MKRNNDAYLTIALKFLLGAYSTIIPDITSSISKKQKFSLIFNFHCCYENGRFLKNLPNIVFKVEKNCQK